MKTKRLLIVLFVANLVCGILNSIGGNIGLAFLNFVATFLLLRAI